MRERRLRRLGLISGPNNAGAAAPSSTTTTTTAPTMDSAITVDPTVVNPLAKTTVSSSPTTTTTLDAQKNKIPSIISGDHEISGNVTSKTTAESLDEDDDDDGNERQLKHQKFDEDADVTRQSIKDTFLNNNEDAGLFCILN